MMLDDDQRPAFFRKASFLVILSAVGLAGSLLLFRTSPELPKRPVVRRHLVAAQASEDSQEATEIREVAPEVAETPMELPEAMDLTLARDQLARLRMSAATGDAATCASARSGLARMGRQARSLLDEALRAETDPRVRDQFEMARAALR
jgi:hypothetical protein